MFKAFHPCGEVGCVIRLCRVGVPSLPPEGLALGISHVPGRNHVCPPAWVDASESSQNLVGAAPYRLGSRLSMTPTGERATSLPFGDPDPALRRPRLDNQQRRFRV